MKSDNGLFEWGAYSASMPFVPAKAEFIMDELSRIEGKNVSIDVRSESGMVLDFDKLELPENLANDLTNELADIFNKVVDGLLKDINGKIPQGKKSAEALIKIDGTIIAEDISIKAVADARSEFNHTGTFLPWSNPQAYADSQIIIGGYLRADQNVTISSTAKTTINVKEKEGFFLNIPFDIAVSIGEAESINKIVIATGANVLAGNDISIKALTERSHSISVSGGSGQSYMGLVVGVLLGYAETDVIINGILEATRNMNIMATTDTKKNSVSTIEKMVSESDPEWWLKTAKTAADPAKKIYESIKKMFSSVGNKGGVKGTFDQFGLTGAVSFMHDDVKTNVTIGGSANIIAGADVKISAETINQVAASAFSLIGEYKAGTDKIEKDMAIAASTPLVFMNNSTKAVLEQGAEITAGKNIDIIAETRIPLAAEEHPIYKLYEAFVDDDTTKMEDNLKKFVSSLSGSAGQYFGLGKGLLNTWGQSSAQADEFGGAAMVTYLDITNTTTAQIVGGEIEASNLNVNATTTVELANLVGSFAAATGEEIPKDGLPDISYLERSKFEEIYEAGSSGIGVGGALLLSNIDSTTIARIDGGEITVLGDIGVKAETKAVDIGIAIGGGKSGSFGLDLMANLSFYDSYTLAKIDDAVEVTAHNVFITADDAAYRIGIAGSLTGSSSLSVGISGTSSVMHRDAHAVWGNLLEKDAKGEWTLATIKGDDSPEIEYTETVAESIVTGNVTVQSSLHGLNLIASVAGAYTSDPMDAKRQAYLDDPGVNKMRYVNAKNTNKYTEVENQLKGVEGGLSGSVVYSHIIENSTAGISGNVKISAGALRIEALNSIYDIAVGGGVFAQLAPTSLGISIAGGVAINILDGNTAAYIQPKSKENLLTYNSLNINADRKGNIIAVAVGGEVSLGIGGGLAAGIAVNLIDNDTQVHIQNANLRSSGDFTAKATNSAGIFSLTGALAIGGNVGIGTSVTYNLLEGTTQVYVDGSEIDARNIDISAENKSDIFGISVTGTASGIAAVGVATDIHTLNQIVETVVQNSKMTATHDLAIHALDIKNVDSHVIGIALSKTVGVDGAISIITAQGTTEITLAGANISAGNNLTVDADNTMTLKQFIGTLAVGGVVGVGISTGVNVISQHTNVVSDATSKLIAGGDISVKGASKFEIKEIDAYSLAAGGFAGVAGSVIVSVIEDKSTVTLAGEIKSENGSVILTSESILATESRVGGAGIGGKGGVGAGVEVLIVRNNSTLSVVGMVSAANNITLNANLTRNIDSTTFAGGAGVFFGLGAAVSVINMGGSVDKDQQEAYLESVQVTDSMLENARIADSKGDVISISIDEIANTKGGSVTLQIAGSLTANNGSITANAKADNTVVQNVYGGGGGFVGAGAAVGVLNVKDTITASFTGEATAKNDFRLQGESVNSAATNTVAGAGGLGALGAAVSNVSFRSDVNTTLGAGSEIRGSSVGVSAIQRFRNFDVDTNAGAVGAVGVGGAFNTLNLQGNAIVNIGNGVQIYSPDVSIRAEKNYDNIQTGAFGLAGGLVGGAGTNSTMNIGGNAYVYVKNAIIHSWENDNPEPGDSVALEAVIRVTDTKNIGNVGAGGLAAVADGDTNMSAMIFNTLIDIAGSEILTGTISADAWQHLYNVSAYHTTVSAGAIGVAGGSSSLKWTGFNKINVTNSNFYSWWEDTDFTAGKETSRLDAQTLVFNSSLAPVTTGGMTSAIVDINVVNDIMLTDTQARSVYNVGLRTDGKYEIGTYDKIISIYNMGGDFIGGDDFSRVEASEKIIRNFSNNVMLNDSLLEAGYHWDSWMMIRNIGNNSEDYRNIVFDDSGNIISVTDMSGTFTKDRYNIVPIYGENNEIVAIAVYQPWITINPTSSKESIFTHINDQIKALESHILEDLLHKEWGAAELKVVEINQLKRLLNDYFIGLDMSNTAYNDPYLNPANYGTASFIRIADPIVAAAGDIFINADSIIERGSTLIAHDKPSITITNQSKSFLEISSILEIPNPLRGGGRIIKNDKIVKDANGAVPVIAITNSGGRQKLDRGISYERVLQWS